MILGIDEVGRGPWAGPLVIGAVILPDDKPEWCEALTDSKKLTSKKRESLAEIILKEAPATALGWVSSREIDSLGLSESLRLATRRAVISIQSQEFPFTEIIIDGTQNFLRGTPLESHVTILKKADFLIKEVSAASIIAKVARDSYMTELAKTYPDYAFDSHVGYGTAAHKRAILEHGITSEHRQSFRPIADILAGNPDSYSSNKCCKKHNNKPTTKNLGDRAETIVADYLEAHGHIIIARNHKTPFYEIDIISTKDDHIYFTEVKYRKDEFRGSALSMITEEKRQQMTFAAESFLHFQPHLRRYDPLLAAASVSGRDFHFNGWFPIR